MTLVTIKPVLPGDNTSKRVPYSPVSITSEDEKTKRTFTKVQEETPVRTPIPRWAGASVRVVRTPSPPQKVPLSTASRSKSTPNDAIESLSEAPTEKVQSKVNAIYQLQSTYPTPKPQPSEISIEVAMYALELYDDQRYKYAVQKQQECHIPNPKFSYSRAYRSTDFEEQQSYAMLLQFIEKQQKSEV